MDRDIPYDQAAVCDSRGALGAFDFVGDILCSRCVSVEEELGGDMIGDTGPERARHRVSISINESHSFVSGGWRIVCEGVLFFMADYVHRERYWRVRVYSDGIVDWGPVHVMYAEEQAFLMPSLVSLARCHFGTEWGKEWHTDDMERCDKCGRQYSTVYRVPDDVWVLVSGHKDRDGQLCIECVNRRAYELALDLYWEADVGIFPTDKEEA